MSNDAERSESEEETSEEEEEEEVQKPQPVKTESDADRRRREAEEARKRMEDEERLKREEKERKKAEVRKRLEEASKSKKAKKGFMTPERKKKLRLLLRKMAAEELKKQQEIKALERRRVIKERCGDAKGLDEANEAKIIALCKEYQNRISKLEDAKYDLEYEVRQKDYQINELSISLNDLRGRYIRPALKKVRYDSTKFIKAAKAAELNFRANLKTVDKFKVEAEDKEKPEWALGAKEKGKEEGKEEE